MSPIAAAWRSGTQPRRHRGFTLMELMVVLAVLAILALITLPSYIDRMLREQVAEGVALADLAKPAIEAAWRAGAPLPADNAAAGLPAPEQIVNQRVKAVTVDHGAIHVLFGNRAQKSLDGLVLTVRPAGVEDAHVVPQVWLCGMAQPPAKMTAQGANRTSVPGRMLPVKCR